MGNEEKKEIKLKRIFSQRELIDILGNLIVAEKQMYSFRGVVNLSFNQVGDEVQLSFTMYEN